MTIEEQTSKITDKLYHDYGAGINDDIVFGIKSRTIVEAIIRFTIIALKEEK